MRPPSAYTDFRFERALLEVRYPKAHKYWDDCGKCIDAIETRLPGLSCQKLEEQGFRFIGEEGAGITSAVFFWDKVVILQEASVALSKFSPAAAIFWRVVSQTLEIPKTTRVGHRIFHLLPADGLQEAERWVNERRIWRPEPNLVSWGQPINAGLVLRTVLDGARSVRTEIAPATVRQEGTTRHGVIVDVDFAPTKPPTQSAFDPETFMKSNFAFLERNLASLLEGAR